MASLLSALSNNNEGKDSPLLRQLMNSLLLPQFVALRSPITGKFLGFRTAEPAEYRGFLRCEYDDIWSPYVKLELVPDKKSGFISVRCCYNNRFWRRWDESHWWIVAREESPNTDQSSIWCTLFEPFYDSTTKILSLRMLMNNKCVQDMAIGGDLAGCLFPGQDPANLDSAAKFVLHDMDSLIRLPKYVVFKGNNGKYLARGPQQGNADAYDLLFSESDAGSERAGHEVHWTADGNMSLTCAADWSSKPTPSWTIFSFDLMPGLIPEIAWVGAKITDSPAVFQPIKWGDHTVALRSLYNNKICKKIGGNDDDSGLFASGESIDSGARLEVGESVISRKVYSVEYDLDGAYIYDLQPILLATASATNNTAGTASLTVPISYTEKKTRSWNNSFSFKLGTEMEFSAGIPLIAASKVSVSAEIGYAHEWGGEITEETTIGSSYTASVEAGKTVVVKAIATKGKCNVKFSYVQRDVLLSGDAIKTEMQDGVFEGMNYFDFKFESSTI